MLLGKANVRESEILSATRLPSKSADAQLVGLYLKRGVIFCLELPLRVMGKPRQTQRDKWMQRPSVMKMRAMSDRLREALNTETKYGTALSVSWVAIFRATDPSMWGRLHRQKPDRDNIDKLILDALFREDKGVAEGAIAKYWGKEDVLLLAIEGLEDAA